MDAESFAMKETRQISGECVLIGLTVGGVLGEPDVLSKEHFVK